MKVEFVTNASVLVTLSNGKRILTDPWYSDGIYYGSWYNFPPLTDEQRERYISCHPDYIYVSHLHPDHYDPATLQRFDPATPILIGDLGHDHLKRAIQGLGFANITEMSLDETQAFEGGNLTILRQFEGTGDGLGDDVGYDLDTSIAIRDTDGTFLLHIVDNPIKVGDAKVLLERFGSPDVAILPYGGASFYPHAFPQYSDDEKETKRVGVKDSRLSGFCEVAEILKPKVVIPAAGSYVMGGRIASYSRWLHQATPEDIRSAFAARQMEGTALATLCSGDAVDAGTGDVMPDETALFRNFKEEDRTAYALTLEENRLAHDDVRVPDAFRLVWPRLLMKARANMWRMQERLNLFPAADIEILITGSDGVPIDHVGSNTLVFSFPLDKADGATVGSLEPPPDRAHMRFSIDAPLLLMSLLGAANWNNIEIGALVTCQRTPDRHEPTLHSLMSFFTL